MWPRASVFKKIFGSNKGSSLKTQHVFNCYEASIVLHIKMTNLEALTQRQYQVSAGSAMKHEN